MDKSPPPNLSVAILATGDEILQGDIVNLNAQTIAHLLFEQGINSNTHMTVGDETSAIKAGIYYFLKQHKGLIITGGLGPTSDDLTRFALGEALKKPLILDEVTRKVIEQRLKKYGFTYLPKNNDQQALFPEGATIIPNPNGTAAGCYIENEGTHIFMLPGPPAECIPMITSFVIPILKKNHFQQNRYYKKWFLFGVSEGHIAEELESVVKDYNCTTGYRIFYPYVEFKIYSTHLEDFNKLIPLIEEKIASLIIGDGQHTASDALKNILPKKAKKLHIKDLVSGGTLENILKTPLTYPYLNFLDQSTDTADISITINGLTEYWQNIETSLTEFTLSITDNNNTQIFSKKIPLRGPRVKSYVAEFACQQALLVLIRNRNFFPHN